MSDRFRPPSEEAIKSYADSLKSQSTTKKTESDVKIFESYVRLLHEKRPIDKIPEKELARLLVSYFQVA